MIDTLKNSGALDVTGAQNVIPSTNRVLGAKDLAWDTAHQWLKRSTVE